MNIVEPENVKIDNKELEIEQKLEVEKSVEEPKHNKRSEAEALIETSKELVEKATLTVEETKANVLKAAEAFDETKRNFKNVIFKKSEGLLEKLGFDYVTKEEAEAFELSLGEMNEKKFAVKNITSGKFTGFLLALFVALLTLVTWSYFAIKNLGININELNVEKATNSVNPMLTWVSTDVVPAGGNLVVGGLVVGFSALILAWIVYAIRVALKKSKNLRVAQETLDASTEFCMAQEDSQQKMKELEQHLLESTTELKNLEMILKEQSAVLTRIDYVEGAFDEEKEYHPSSKKVMRETEKIMRASESLFSTPMTEEESVNIQSIEALATAKEIYSEYLSRIYD